MSERVDWNIVLAFRAVGEGRYKLLQEVLDKGVDPDQENILGKTLLYEAIYHGFPHIMEILIKAKADPNLIGKGEKGLLHFACYKGDPEIVKILLDAGADPNLEDKDGETPLFHASNDGVVELLLGVGANPHHIDKTGGCPLHAITDGSNDNEMIQMLLETGANFNLINNYGYTPAYLPVLWNKLDQVRLLLQAGLDPEQAGIDGKTLLSLAAEEGNTKMVELLSSFKKGTVSLVWLCLRMVHYGGQDIVPDWFSPLLLEWD